MMRLGFVVYGSLAEQSGGFQYDRKLVEHLRERGHEVQVVGLPWDRYGRCLLHNLSPGLRSDLAGFDVLLEDHLCHPSLVWGNRSLDTPIVSVVHHLRSSEPRATWKNRIYRAVEHHYFRSVDGAICNSETTRESVLDLHDFHDLRSTVAYPAGDRFAPISPRRTPNWFDEPLRLVFLGNLVPRKGLHVLLSGLSRVRGDWQLSVVGAPTNPTYAERVRHYCKELRLGEKVTFTGRLPNDGVARELTRSHVLAVPSLYEGFGLVYLEGMAFGLPAIATAAGGADEIVSDGDTGFVLPPDDPDAVAAAVRIFRDDRGLLRRMSEASRERFESHPDWNDATDAVERLLDEVTGGASTIPAET
ncbi:glycosyltransferase family 4 protein [Haladaptatus sp. NG-SE-30]